MNPPETPERPPASRLVGLKAEGFENAPIPLLVVTGAGRLVEANDAAMDLVRAGVLQFGDGPVSLGPPNSDERLLAMLSARDPERGSRELIVPGHDGRALRIQARMLSDGANLLVIRKLVGDSPPVMDAVAEAYHLTTSEQRLLEHLVAGLSPSEAAQVLDISVNTVRTYIRSLLLKSDQRNLTSLLCHAIQMA